MGWEKPSPPRQLALSGCVFPNQKRGAARPDPTGGGIGRWRGVQGGDPTAGQRTAFGSHHPTHPAVVTGVSWSFAKAL